MHPLTHLPASHSLARIGLLAALACGAALPASATVMTATQLNVYRDGTSVEWLQGLNRLLGDSFDNGDPFVGPNFANTGTPAAYTLLGLANAADLGLAVQEAGGLLTLDSTYGLVSANAQGGLGNSLRLRLQTNITDPAVGLPISRSFSGTLRLMLSAMPDAGQSFGFRLNDSGIGTSNNDVIELFVSGGAAGDSIVFRKQDFDNKVISVLGSAPLSAPADAAMLVLSMSHSTPDSDQIFGSYAFADASGALTTPFTTFGNSATAFQGEAHTRIELRATGVPVGVPEPGSWALLAAGLGLGLLWQAKRARRGR